MAETRRPDEKVSLDPETVDETQRSQEELSQGGDKKWLEPVVTMLTGEIEDSEKLEKTFRCSDPDVQKALDLISLHGGDLDKWLEPVVTMLMNDVEEGDIQDIVVQGDQRMKYILYDDFLVADGELVKDVLVKIARRVMGGFTPSMYEHRYIFDLEMLIRNVFKMIRLIVNKPWDPSLNDWEHKVRRAGKEFTDARIEMETQRARQELLKRKREDGEQPDLTKPAPDAAEILFCSSECKQRNGKASVLKRGKTEMARLCDC